MLEYTTIGVVISIKAISIEAYILYIVLLSKRIFKDYRVSGKVIITLILIPLVLILAVLYLWLLPLSKLMYLLPEYIVLLLIIHIIAGLYLLIKRYKQYNAITCAYAFLALIITFALLGHKLIVEIEYRNTVQQLSSAVKCKNHITIECIWTFVREFTEHFKSRATYGKPLPKPQHLLCSPLFSIDEVSKLAAIKKTGACLDFALAITKLIEDLFGCTTRVVSVEGADHAIPEVLVGETWYVIDAVFTTQEKPIKVKHYAKHLANQSKVNKNIAKLYHALVRLVDIMTHDDITSEHGFQVVMLTINAIYDATPQQGDEKPVSNAEVLVYLPSSKGFYDTLVLKTYTDERGLATAELVTGKEYVIVVRKNSLIGVEIVHISTSIKSMKIEILMYLEK
ncbi:MAG: hypothetical protein DRJ69_06820 [Thermoprotei archaeon]|nr:MAG: hypothetical protein DRJ69_06820 [Thermoprotei archaeon]